LGLVLEHREDGLARVSVLVEPKHANTLGVAHGGVLTSVMDTACGSAVAYQPSIGGKGVMTVSIQVSYLGASFVGDRITATARCRGRGKRLLTLDVEAANQKGDVVAIGLCTLRVRSGDAPFAPSSE
jgi:acyl-CoA thioesterase